MLVNAEEGVCPQFLPLTGWFVSWGYSSELAEEVAKELKQTIQIHIFN